MEAHTDTHTHNTATLLLMATDRQGGDVPKVNVSEALVAGKLKWQLIHFDVGLTIPPLMCPIDGNLPLWQMTADAFSSSTQHGMTCGEIKPLN